MDYYSKENIMDYYKSICELNDDLWADYFKTPYPAWTDPLDTATCSTTSHQVTKTVKKSNKKLSAEQRSKQKKSHRASIDDTPIDDTSF